MPDIDIVGLDPRGERILAQVTFSKNRSKVREKAEALARYSALSPQLLFFAPAAMKDQIENQRFIPLEEVWDYWAKRSGGIFLKDFFGKGSDPTEPADRVRTLITDSANGQFFPIVEDGTAGVPGPVP